MTSLLVKERRRSERRIPGLAAIYHLISLDPREGSRYERRNRIDFGALIEINPLKIAPQQDTYEL